MEIRNLIDILTSLPVVGTRFATAIINYRTAKERADIDNDGRLEENGQQKTNHETLDISNRQEAVERLKTNTDIFKLISKFVCFNQSLIAQYDVLSRKRHTELNSLLTTVQSFGNDDRIVQGSVLPSLKKAQEKLDSYLEGELYRICDINQQYIIDYFMMRSRSTIEPRFCIKIVQEEEAVNLFIRSGRAFVNDDCEISENTALQAIWGGSRFYVCNNIPEFISANQYTNPRINLDLAKVYYLQQKNDESTLGWEECWKKVETKSGIINCPSDCVYKSTLVIPMAFINAELSNEFKEIFKINKDSRKSIYGFLCFDHQEIDYFDEEIDSRIGFIFADILSLYFVQQYSLTNYSSTYFLASGLLQND